VNLAGSQGDEDEWMMNEHSRASGLLLGAYTVHDLVANLDKFGIARDLAKRGYNHLQVSTETNGPSVHRLKVSDRSILAAGKKDEEALLIDLFARKKNISPMEFIPLKQEYWEPDNPAHPNTSSSFMSENMNFTTQALVIEWLTSQDPLRGFTEERPMLPGQHHPGLGIIVEVYEMLFAIAKENDCGSILNVPVYFHNALMYHTKGCKFVDPALEGLFVSLAHDLLPEIEKHGLSAVSWALHLNCVKHKVSGRAVHWKAREQLAPLSPQLKAYFASETYLHKVNECSTTNQFEIDWTNSQLSNFVHTKQ